MSASALDQRVSATTRSELAALREYTSRLDEIDAGSAREGDRISVSQIRAYVNQLRAESGSEGASLGVTRTRSAAAASSDEEDEDEDEDAEGAAARRRSRRRNLAPAFGAVRPASSPRGGRSPARSSGSPHDGSRERISDLVRLQKLRNRLAEVMADDGAPQPTPPEQGQAADQKAGSSSARTSAAGAPQPGAERLLSASASRRESTVTRRVATSSSATISTRRGPPRRRSAAALDVAAAGTARVRLSAPRPRSAPRTRASDDGSSSRARSRRASTPPPGQPYGRRLSAGPWLVPVPALRRLSAPARPTPRLTAAEASGRTELLSASWTRAQPARAWGPTAERAPDQHGRARAPHAATAQLSYTASKSAVRMPPPPTASRTRRAAPTRPVPDASLGARMRRLESENSRLRALLLAAQDGRRGATRRPPTRGGGVHGGPPRAPPSDVDVAALQAALEQSEAARRRQERHIAVLTDELAHLAAIASDGPAAAAALSRAGGAAASHGERAGRGMAGADPGADSESSGDA